MQLRLGVNRMSMGEAMSDATDEALCGIPVQLRESDYERGYERGATDARAKLLAEVCAWLRTPELATRVGSRRLPLTVADAIEAKFKATG